MSQKMEQTEDIPGENHQEYSQEEYLYDSDDSTMSLDEEPPAKRLCQEATPNEEATQNLQNEEPQAEMQSGETNNDYDMNAINRFMAKIALDNAMLVAMSAYAEALIIQINLLTPKLNDGIIYLIHKSHRISVEVSQGTRPLTAVTIGKMRELQLQLINRKNLVQGLLNKLDDYTFTILRLQDAETRDTDMEIQMLKDMEATMDGLLRTIEDMTCSICTNEYSQGGGHRLVSLPCGHLFGRQCILRTLQNSPQCPTCSKPYTKTDIKRSYCH